MAVRPDSTTQSAAPRHDVSDTDLEQYGVWVKAEPHDIVEEPEAKNAEGLGGSEFDLPSDSPALPEESFLTEDEEKLIGSFGEIGSGGEAEEPAPQKASAQGAETAFPDLEDLPPLEDFEIGAEEKKFSPNADIDLEEIEGLEEASPLEAAPLEAAPLGEASSREPEAATEMEDVSAEFLDVIEEEPAPKAAASSFRGEAAAPEPATLPKEEFEPLDIDLSFDDSLAPNKKAEAGFEEVSDFDDFLKEEPAQEAAPAKAEAGFDDLAALEAELAEPKAAAEPQAAQPEEPKANLSNELLLKIAEELSSIRGELVNLKGQLCALQKEEEPAKEAAAPAIAAEEKKEKSADKRGGFFDEEEDETIALTGDELDNILNTADFTEESAPEAAQEAEVAPAEELVEESLLPESGDYAAAEKAEAEEPAIEEIRLEPESEEPPLEAVEGEELVGMAEFAEEGVQPMTSAPEDTSYLEEPLANEAPLDLDETPLHEEPLVEPDLSSFRIEEETEPEAEVAEELPVIEGPSESESSPEALADITLGVEAAAGYMPEAGAEPLPVQPIPEIDTTSFEEIELPGETELAEEVEELASAEEAPQPIKEAEAADLEEEISERTVKPAEPVALHPDEIPMSLDDSFFVESPAELSAAEPSPLEEVEEAEPLAEELVEEPFTLESLAEEPLDLEAAPAAEEPAAIEPAVEKAEQVEPKREEGSNERLKGEIRGVLSYLDKLLESLPEDKIEEFARSEYFDTYKKLFEELGLV